MAGSKRRSSCLERPRGRSRRSSGPLAILIIVVLYCSSSYVCSAAKATKAGGGAVRPLRRRLREESAADATWASLFGGGSDPAPHAPAGAHHHRGTSKAGAEQQQQQGENNKSSSSSSSSSSAGDAASTSSSSSTGNSSSSTTSSNSSGKPQAGTDPAGELKLPDYNWMLTPLQREAGLTYMGAAARLRVALDRAVQRRRLTVAVIGGSISSGIGAFDDLRDAWVDRFESYLRSLYEPLGVRVVVNNGAVPGTTSAFMCACFRRHVPEDADIVIVEYAVNDEARPFPAFANAARRPFERLIRKLLMLPSRPAVVLLNAYSWFRTEPDTGTFWYGAEGEYQEFAWYYGLPTASVKAAAYPAMLAGARGFEVEKPRELVPGAAEAGGALDPLRGRAFYYDFVHPDGNTGHRVMAELAMHLIGTAATAAAARPPGDEERLFADAPLLRPMVRGNHAALHDACFVGPAFKDKCVVGHEGWAWVNEAKDWKARPKWGYVANEPGKMLKLRVNATAAAGLRDRPVAVQIAHLRSFAHMGWAEVSCLSGCQCAASRFNGHCEEKKSVLVLHRLFVSQHERCELGVTVLNDTDSGEHKVKVAGAIVSDAAAENSDGSGGGDSGEGGLDNAGAVEHVHDVSFRAGRGAGGVFDIRNHVK